MKVPDHDHVVIEIQRGGLLKLVTTAGTPNMGRKIVAQAAAGVRADQIAGKRVPNPPIGWLMVEADRFTLAGEAL